MKSKKNEMTPMPDTQIGDAIGLIDGGLQLLLAAVHADDPKREMLVRVGDLLRDVRSLEAALSGHVLGWRTMDSAPKDGTHFLAIYGDDDDGTYWILFWNGTFFECVSAGYQVEHATHWQPLPAPPVPEMEGG